MMKRIFTAIAVLGFVLAYGTAGTSDFEVETGIQLMTNAEFYTRIAISLVMLVGGSIGSKLYKTTPTHQTSVQVNTEGIQATYPTQCINDKT